MKSTMSGLMIRAIATGLPRGVREMDEYAEEFGAKAIARIKKSTGVERVHVSEEGKCSSDYTLETARRLLAETGLGADAVDGLVNICQTPDFPVPCSAVILQHRLGLPRDAVCFDINWGCSGYIYGLYQASMLIRAGGCERVLVLTGDTQSRMIHAADRGNRMVLGDGFSATLVEKGEGTLHFNIKSDGAGYKYIWQEAGGYRLPKELAADEPIYDDRNNPRWQKYSYMDGMEIMNFALSRVPPLVEETLTAAGWSKEEVSIFAMHQANQLILQFLAKRLGVTLEKMPIALKETGNCVSASIPLMLSTMKNALPPLNKVVMCGFGVGLSWGTACADLSSTVILDSYII